MTLTIELPDEIAGQARSAGLLEPANVARIFQEKLAENGDPRSFFDLARTLREVPGEPMTLEEIQAEVDVVRASHTNGTTDETGR